MTIGAVEMTIGAALYYVRSYGPSDTRRISNSRSVASTDARRVYCASCARPGDVAGQNEDVAGLCCFGCGDVLPSRRVVEAWGDV